MNYPHIGYERTSFCGITFHPSELKDFKGDTSSITCVECFRQYLKKELWDKEYDKDEQGRSRVQP